MIVKLIVLNGQYGNHVFRVGKSSFDANEEIVESIEEHPRNIHTYIIKFTGGLEAEVISDKVIILSQY